jgi:RNA polymerase sigma-B factor
VEDAVAVVVAFNQATDHRDTDPMDAFSQPGDGGPIERGVSLADIRKVPAESRVTSLERHDSRWMAAESTAENVLLGDPNGPVDLVTLRPTERDEEVLASAIEHVDVGGLLLVIGPAAGTIDLTGRTKVEDLGGSPTARLFRKRGRASMCRKARVGPHTAGPTLAHRRSRDHLVQGHTPLARSLARRYTYRGESTDDLEQVAMLALIKAADRFDPDRDTRFTTYASASIVGELKRHFRDKAWLMRVPRSVQETYLELKTARDELTQTLGDTPTPTQLAQHLGTNEAAISDALMAGDNYWPESLDGDRDLPPTEVPVVDESFDRVLDRLHLQNRAPLLDPEEALVLERIYFESCTQREVAAELGISQMQVSRFQARALSKLRN